MLADAVWFKVFAPQGWGIVPVCVRRVAVSQPLGQVLDILAGIGWKEIEKAVSVLLVLNVGECGGSHCLACQFSIEITLGVGGSCGSYSLLISVGIDGEARRPVFGPVMLLVTKNFLEQLAWGAAIPRIRQRACVQEGVDCDEQRLGVQGVIELLENIAHWWRSWRLSE